MSVVSDSKPGSIPSCGLTLLQAPINTFDYTVHLTDGKVRVKILCHRCVLWSHSERLRDLITNENYFDMEIKVKPGYLTACVELFQYMYLKDPTLVTNSTKILELCGMFHMKLDHFIIREEKAVQFNLYPTTHLTLQVPNTATFKSQESCVIAQDFVKLVSFTNVIVPIQQEKTKTEEAVVEKVKLPTSGTRTWPKVSLKDLNNIMCTHQPKQPQRKSKRRRRTPVLN